MFELFATDGLHYKAIGEVLFVSLCFGSIIAFTYQKFSNGFTYVEYFWKALILLCMIVASIMFTIGTNVVLSLGLVGALSIIRFRSAVREFEDAIFIFLSIGVGLACGTRSFKIAFLMTIISCITWALLKSINLGKFNGSYMLVLQTKSMDINNLESILKENVDKFKLKSLSSSKRNNEETSEIVFTIAPYKQVSLAQLISKLKEQSEVVECDIYSPNNSFGV